MYLRLPIGFNFNKYTDIKDILDSQISKFVKTWKKHRLYKSNYGVSWENFDSTKYSNKDDLKDKLTTFLTEQLTYLSEITINDIEINEYLNPYRFSFYLIYKYKGILDSKVLIQINLDGQILIGINSGIE